MRGQYRRYNWKCLLKNAHIKYRDKNYKINRVQRNVSILSDRCRYFPILVDTFRYTPIQTQVSALIIRYNTDTEFWVSKKVDTEPIRYRYSQNVSKLIHYSESCRVSRFSADLYPFWTWLLWTLLVKMGFLWLWWRFYHFCFFIMTIHPHCACKPLSW